MAELARQILVSCEHASNRLPPGYELDERLRALHIAWDPGALPIAERLAARFQAPLWAGEYSRLVADLNRTQGNRVLMRQVSDGHRIPFNYGLDEPARRERLDRYYLPYRRGVETGVREIISREGRCLHICVHTFTPALAGRVRGNDIGLLHDPGWGIERAVSRDLRAHLERRTDYVVWFNRPYSGTADGILPAMRRQNTPDRFVGIELEVNQKYAADRDRLDHIADAIADAFEASSSLRG